MFGFKTADLLQGQYAPKFTITGDSQQGRLEPWHKASWFVHDLCFMFVCSGKLGWAVASSARTLLASSAVLAISVPTMGDKVGTVALLPMDTIPAGDWSFTTAVANAITVFTSGVQGSRFGWTLTFGDVTGDGIDDFVVSSPFESESWALSSSQRSVGAVYLYPGGSTFPNGNVTGAENAASWSVQGGALDSRVGSSVLAANITIPGVSSGVQLLVAAPFASVDLTEVGVVTMYGF